MSNPFQSGWERPDTDMSSHSSTKQAGSGGYITIGYINSPYQDPTQIPMVPLAINDTQGTIEILPEFALGLQKLENFDYIYVIYSLHRPIKPQIKVTPPFQNEEFGVFATRFNCRPNALAMSLLHLEKIEGNVLHVRGIDMIDGEAVLDIKPYSEDFDKIP
jgi:tRNA-Thr(GGU) m(6)t(6)A37 methyltransferase TsaA